MNQVIFRTDVWFRLQYRLSSQKIRNVLSGIAGIDGYGGTIIMWSIVIKPTGVACSSEFFVNLWFNGVFSLNRLGKTLHRLK